MSIKDLRAQILSMSSGLAIEPINIEGLPDNLYIKQLNAYEREVLEEAMAQETAKYSVRATVFAHSICDADGVLVFDEKDIEQIGLLPMPIIAKVFTESNKLNGITEDAVDKAEKNS